MYWGRTICLSNLSPNDWTKPETKGVTGEHSNRVLQMSTGSLQNLRDCFCLGIARLALDEKVPSLTPLKWLGHILIGQHIEDILQL